MPILDDWLAKLEKASGDALKLIEWAAKERGRPPTAEEVLPAAQMAGLVAEIRRLRDGYRYILGADVAGMPGHMGAAEVARMMLGERSEDAREP